ncbi:RTX toxin [Pseudomonas sp. IT-347P]|uniref:dermonecrotic toxin domain-containing protein n=1 Tax=Pseudomonas sp. IT-347P TaxID=3026458 RepID=UPI0039E0EF93
MSTSATPATADTSAIVARAVSAQFSNRPALRSQTARLLKDGLLEKYPELDFDPDRTRLARPIPDGAWSLSLLLDEVLAYIATGVKLDLADQYGRNCFLTNKLPKQMSIGKTTTRLPDMQVIADVILELPTILYIGLQEAVTSYWNEDIGAGVSRWQWLGDLLTGALRTAAVRRVGLNAAQAEVLMELAEHPDRRVRSQKPGPRGMIQACTLETTLSKGTVSATIQTPDLLVSCADTHLLCSVTGSVEVYASLGEFGLAWAERFQQHFTTDTISWKRFEPDGNIFDIQAALVLNQQLENIAALPLPANQPLDTLQQRLDAITNVAGLFSDTPPQPGNLQPIAASLPDWLQTADASDRMAYRQHVLALATLRQQTQGRTFNDGIDDLPTFARKALHKQMLEDQPQAPGYNADDLELTFHVPVGDLGSGYLDKVKMSLTELAIKNLAGKPKGRMTIRHTGNQLIQDWTTETYLLDLVSRVDVGKHYPALLEDLLLGNSTETRERECLFSRELAIQLPLQALEHAIRAEHGFDRLGYRYVNALMQHTAAQRVVDGLAIVIRPLAFQRKAHADWDQVTNMFIIEPKDLNAEGPCILYRPMYAPALQQFASRHDLFKAIAVDGPLQSSVLTWMTDRARPIYANNGFNEPHIVHFHLGDDFTPFEKPAPAMLAGDVAAADWLKAVEEDRVLASLFASNARALIQTADQQSVSNAESRWALILEGGWLIFNTLLLPLDGPAMVVGWMVQLTHSLINDLPALDSADAATRNQAWTDLLLNIGLVLLHVAKGSVTTPLPDSADRLVPAVLEPMRHPSDSYPSLFEPVIRQQSPALPAAPPGNGRTTVDFKLSTAREPAATRLLDTLMQAHVPWPAQLPDPVATGAFKGLYQIDNQWHASIGGLLVRVRTVPGFGEVYLASSEHPGLRLKSNGKGQWTLERGAKLVGGGPKPRIKNQREQTQRRIEVLDRNYTIFVEQQAAVQRGVDIAERLMIQQRDLPTATEPARARFRQIFDSKLSQQTDQYLTQIAELKEKAVLKKTDPAYTAIAPLLENSLNNVRKRIIMADLDRQALLRRYPEFNRGPREVADSLLVGGEARREQYLDFLRETSRINENMIKLYEEADSRLLELKNIPRLGPEAWERLTAGRAGRELTALRLKAFQLQILRPISVKAWAVQSMLGLDDAIDPVVLLSRSHADLQGAEVYDSADRIAVFDNLVDRYGKAQDALESIGIFHGDELEAAPFNRLREIIGDLRVDAEQRLADELQQLPEQEPVPGPSSDNAQAPARPAVPRASRKKVIKTQTKGTLIGDLRPRVANQGADIVDIKNPMDESTLLSFHEQAPNVWEVVEAETEQPPPQPRVAPYSKLKGDARKALGKVDLQVQKIEGYVQRASSPREIEEQLQREAGKLTAFAENLQSHDNAPANREQDQLLISQLRAKADALVTKASELRTRMTLSKPPTSEGVEYLLDRRVIYARRVDGRIQLKTGRKDFLQEYVLLDQRNEPLWYAHFHYTNETDAKADYRRAHLKTREQQYMTYELAMAQAKDPQQKIDIHRGDISPELAETVFLPLEPR